ncbi:MAG: OmpA family protein [Crocinitomicaceae bacterium]
MKFFSLIFLFALSYNSFTQEHSLDGVWQGIIYEDGQKVKEGKAFWMDFNIDNNSGEFTGENRAEQPYKEFFAYKRMKGNATSDSSLHFEDINIRQKKESSRLIWCLNEGDLVYNRETGYLEGSWKSSDCRRQQGKIIMFRSKYNLSTTDTNSLYHSWFDNFVGDLRRGWKAYYVRDAEMRNFEFVPVYFDHDMDQLKPEFNDYLNQMVKIVLSHSDLRIKIIGHTDSNGTDEYNVDLSARRAHRIKDYLIAQGLKADRVIIEYRGERDPATSNATKQGKSLNRRVDFEFI